MDDVSKQQWGPTDQASVERVKAILLAQQEAYDKRKQTCVTLEAKAKLMGTKEKEAHAAYAEKGETAWYTPGCWAVRFGKTCIRPVRLTEEQCIFTIKDRDPLLEEVKAWYGDRNHKLLSDVRKGKKRAWALLKETKDLMALPSKRAHVQNHFVTSDTV